MITGETKRSQIILLKMLTRNTLHQKQLAKNKNKLYLIIQLNGRNI